MTRYAVNVGQWQFVLKEKRSKGDFSWEHPSRYRYGRSKTTTRTDSGAGPSTTTTTRTDPGAGPSTTTTTSAPSSPGVQSPQDAETPRKDDDAAETVTR